MALISQVVRNALFSGCLTIEAEAILSQQFDGGCSLEDITALTLLQRAVLSGRVKRLSQNRQTIPMGIDRLCSPG